MDLVGGIDNPYMGVRQRGARNERGPRACVHRHEGVGVPEYVGASGETQAPG